jgi:hypothetical protein
MLYRVAHIKSAEQNLQNTCVLGLCSVSVGNKSPSFGNATAAVAVAGVCSVPYQQLHHY